jgi:hypothetical protein
MFGVIHPFGKRVSITALPSSARAPSKWNVILPHSSERGDLLCKRSEVDAQLAEKAQSRNHSMERIVKEIGLAYACQGCAFHVTGPVSENPVPQDLAQYDRLRKESSLLGSLAFFFVLVEKPRFSSDLTAFTRLCPRPFCFQLASFQPERFALLVGAVAVFNVGGT